MSLASEFEHEVQSEIQAKIESGFDKFREHVVMGVKARLAAAKDLYELNEIGKKYGYTQKRMNSYARSHA